MSTAKSSLKAKIIIQITNPRNEKEWLVQKESGQISEFLAKDI
jgi:hypothetical protein